MTILYQDNHLLVVVKPAGVLSQADRTGDKDLLTQAKAYIKREFDKPGNVYLGLVHRLDRPVSGVMVLARTSKAADRLSRAFRKREVEKGYLALVEGHLAGSGTCANWLLKDKGHVRVVPKETEKARPARLTWRSAAHSDQLSLVDVDLHTGRPHQVRVQLAHMGYPILGDLRYHAQREFDGRNLALHAYKLAFEHPVQKERVEFRCPPPSTWSGYFDRAVTALVQPELLSLPR
ncbi:MAG: RNA pseudouridine synthase [Rubricoccaceae bacterium]|nr:RNA pseudouridine synthase [Rubricoccaceae bacterium]